jgi:hypothetical protein
VVALVAFLMLLIALPSVVERVTHAVHAGPERAAAEAAREALQAVDVRKLSEGFGLVATAMNSRSCSGRRARKRSAKALA